MQGYIFILSMLSQSLKYYHRFNHDQNQSSLEGETTRRKKGKDDVSLLLALISKTETFSPFCRSHEIEIVALSVTAVENSKLEGSTSLFKAQTTRRKGDDGWEQILGILDDGGKKGGKEWRSGSGKDSNYKCRKVGSYWVLEQMKEDGWDRAPKHFFLESRAH